MPDGSLWGVPASLIAVRRAEFYAKRDPDTTYEEEFKYTLESDGELTEWLANNMSWKEVKPFAVRLADQDPVDYEEGICNGEKEVVR